MLVLTQDYDPQEGPILNVRISPQGAPQNGMVFPMLLDSGADGSSVSGDVIAALSLIQVGKRAAYTSGGKVGSIRTFTVDIALPFDNPVWSQVGLLVSEFHYVKPSIRGLIGRDILSRGNFSMFRDHSFSLELF